MYYNVYRLIKKGWRPIAKEVLQMLNIMKEKEYGVLFVAKAEGLDYEN
jgi:hypothetical protein